MIKGSFLKLLPKESFKKMIQSKRAVQFCAFGLENTETGSGTMVIIFNENHSKHPKYFLTKVITMKLNENGYKFTGHL